MESPIRNIIPYFVGAMVSVAPERESELRGFMTERAISLRETDRKGFVFAADTEEKAILYSATGLEFLWAASYSYWVLYQTAQRASKADANKLMFCDYPELKDAIDLYVWALGNCRNQDSQPWPQGLPKPSMDPIQGSNIHAATELAACAAGWILHHELAHLRLGHSKTIVETIAKQEERDADKLAVEWIMTGTQAPEKVRKRALGIALGLIAIVSLDLDRGTFISPSHPKSFERLYAGLSNCKLNPNHEVYAFACLMLKLNVDHSQFEIEITEYKDTFSDYLDELTFLLSRV